VVKKHELTDETKSVTRECIESLKNISSDLIGVKGWRTSEVLSRYFDFSVRGANYTIEWWSNISYLHCGELIIPFTRLSYLGTWPNSFKHNLQFYYHGDVCAILPVEEWEGENE